MATDKTIVVITGTSLLQTETHKSTDKKTGGNSGIGFCTAQALSTSLKYHVIIGSRTPSKGSQAVKDVLAYSPNASISTIQLDVTDQASIKAAAAHLEKEFGRLDVLINNAGIIDHNPNLLENLRTVFETNTFGPAVVTEAFLPLLEKSKDARLVYVSSGLGSIAMRANPSDRYYKLPATMYRMSKSALNST